jgi:hypothetical protein
MDDPDESRLPPQADSRRSQRSDTIHGNPIGFSSQPPNLMSITFISLSMEQLQDEQSHGVSEMHCLDTKMPGVNVGRRRIGNLEAPCSR